MIITYHAFITLTRVFARLIPASKTARDIPEGHRTADATEETNKIEEEIQEEKGWESERATDVLKENARQGSIVDGGVQRPGRNKYSRNPRLTS